MTLKDPSPFSTAAFFPAFSTPVRKKLNFHPCSPLLCFPLLRFPPLQTHLAFSTRAFSIRPTVRPT